MFIWASSLVLEILCLSCEEACWRMKSMCSIASITQPTLRIRAAKMTHSCSQMLKKVQSTIHLKLNLPTHIIRK